MNLLQMGSIIPLWAVVFDVGLWKTFAASGPPFRYGARPGILFLCFLCSRQVADMWMLMLTHPQTELLWWVDSDVIFTDMLFEPPWDKYAGHNLVLPGSEEKVYTVKS
jgi:hypothetical protein